MDIMAVITAAVVPDFHVGFFFFWIPNKNSISAHISLPLPFEILQIGGSWEIVLNRNSGALGISLCKLVSNCV